MTRRGQLLSCVIVIAAVCRKKPRTRFPFPRGAARRLKSIDISPGAKNFNFSNRENRKNVLSRHYYAEMMRQGTTELGSAPSHRRCVKHLSSCVIGDKDSHENSHTEKFLLGISGDFSSSFVEVYRDTRNPIARSME